MRFRRTALPSLPILSLATAACVFLALAAFVLAASPRLVNAESAAGKYAAFAVSPTEIVVAGTVVGVNDGLLGIQEVDAAAPVAFPLAAGAALSRDGRSVSLAELRAGDRVQLTVDYVSGQAVEVAAVAAPSPWFQPTSGHAAIAALGLIVATVLLIRRERASVKPVPAVAPTPAPAPATAAAPARLPRTDLPVALFDRHHRPEAA